VRLLVPVLTSLYLLQKTFPLVSGVIQFRECIGYFPSRDEQLKPLAKARFCIAAARQGRDFQRIVGDEGGLNQFGFHAQVKELRQ